MFRTDTGNFNRFLTSLGLLLLLGALVLPYFYLRDTETLRVSAQELKGLTQVGRDALETRQRRQADLEVWVLAFAGFLALCGVGALWLGGRRLRVAQGKEDAAIDRKAKRDDVEIERMSRSEVEEKRDVNVREAVEAEAEPPNVSRPVKSEPAPARGRNLGDVRYRENREALVRIEEVLRSLDGIAFDSHKFLSEVKTRRDSQQLPLDGLFRANRPTGVDVVLELKVVRQSRSIRAGSRQFSDALLALIARYRQVTQRRATGWLLVVIPDEVEPPPLPERRRLEDQLNDSLAGLARATILPEGELTNLPQRFAEIFAAQAK